jgi:hypothetical protein
MVTVVTATWSFEATFDIQNTLLYKSFITRNTEKNFHHVHFDRNQYANLELEFSNRFGTQADYILYKIFLLRDAIKSINSEYIVFCDANDVVCLGDVSTLTPVHNYVLMSAEANQWPSSRGDFGGLDYSKDAFQKRQFLNSGLLFARKDVYLELLTSIIDNILPKNIKSFGGDQGVFTYHYLAKSMPQIQLDVENTMFLSTFSRQVEDFVGYNFPMFIHDNGWDWGSPRFIQKFNLCPDCTI